MRPEEAIEAARERAARERAGGAYARDLHDVELAPAGERVSSDQLMEWAVIEPDPLLVVSTRRWGRPISLLKRLAMHVLRQYLAQLESQQTRFNVHLLARVVEQEERLATMEDWLRDETQEPGPRSGPGS